MKEQHLKEAFSILSARRNYARTTQEAHLQEVKQTIPEIAEINRQLFHTSQDLMQIITRTYQTTRFAESARTENDPSAAFYARLSGKLLGHYLQVSLL